MTVSTVITAAGDSENLFLSAGFGLPKNLITLGGREIILRALDAYAIDPNQCTVGLNADECDRWRTDLLIVSAFPSAVVVRINPGAQGALVTALLALEGVPEDEPLVIAAGDSEIRGGIREQIETFMSMSVDAGTIVFPSSGSRWSYILPGRGRTVRQVAEKRVIGPFATTGVFFFRTAGDFRESAEWCLVNNARDRGIFYVSTALNFLIERGKHVIYEEVEPNSYRSWSRPADFAGHPLDLKNEEGAT